MSSRVPQEIHLQVMFDQFWSQLTWKKLEKRIEEALRHPNRAVPLETNCPAVTDLASQVINGLIGSAIKRQGEPVSPEETFTFDQRLVILRIIEAVISEYEDFKNGKFSERVTSELRSNFPSLPGK